MKTNKITVIQIHEPDSDEGDEVYRLDEQDAGEHLFNNLMNNFERGQKYSFTIKELTKKQWDECEEAGNFIAGNMTEKQQDAYLLKMKRKNKRSKNGKTKEISTRNF